MEPWLDSLSEDWKSEQPSSSPAPSLSSSRQHGSVALSRSQSRIPHLANNIRKNSTTGSFLRHRSTHGKARQGSHSILRERSTSSLNLPPVPDSQKYSSLPRRTSNAFSESQNSVQHHSVREQPTLAETPEWKRRLAVGEELNSDGFDLFSPSKLEGVFKQPNSSQLHSDKDPEPVEPSLHRKPFNLPAANLFAEPYSSYRGTARGRVNLEVLEEVNEEEESEQHKLSAILSDVVKNGSLRGLVKQRVKSFERAEEGLDSQPGSESLGPDHRWNTSSGLEELRNEYISPVTMSKQNSIRNTIMRNSLDVDVEALQDKLRQAASDEVERPSSSASDSFIDYARKEEPEALLHDEPLPDLTSQSLPDDLSMGTQIFETHGGFINSRRGGRSNEASFLRKSLSLSQEPSHLETNTRPDIQINSSPPLPSRQFDESIEQSRISASAPTSPHDTSVIHHADNHLRAASSGSPLKLFGNRDTYTNNKLMRILSHFEEPGDSRGHKKQDDVPEEAEEQGFRMSQFGQGELDGFGFEKDVRKPSPVQIAAKTAGDRIFKALNADNEAGDAPRNVQEHPSEVAEVAFNEKDRTTKRRKTLFKDQVSVLDHEIEVKISELEENATLAGKKRKDARPGDEGVPAEPDVLATRDLLRPKSTRKSSLNQIRPDSVAERDAGRKSTEAAQEDLTEALAAELATFAQEAAHVNNDSRKPSLATKDYMEEANKVMQFIRSRGKPKPVAAIPEISEPADVSEVNPDSILDLDLDGESTKDDFSRPPSREHTPKPAFDRRYAQHDSRTASYLRKYRDEDDTDALGTISVFGTLAPKNRPVEPEVISKAVEEELQESSPPNIRILNPSETMRKRKHSSSTVEHGSMHNQIQTQHSASSLTQHSFPTSSSTSGHKGVISSGAVSIPDHVGTMTFDHEKKIWVKKMSDDMGARSKSRQQQHTFTEDDPFGDIPDLSIEEQQELNTEAGSLDATVAHNGAPSGAPTQATKTVPQISSKPQPDVGTIVDEEKQLQSANEDDTVEIDRSTLRSKASEHEAKLHNGVPSAPPSRLKDERKQARVVTIAFSSPVVSGVNYANLSEDDFSELPREEDLPLDDSEVHFEEEAEEQRAGQTATTEKTHSQRNSTFRPVLDHEEAIAFQPRTISPIVEDDEEHFDPQMSLVHVKHSKVVTPAPNKSIAKLQKNGNKASSILCLTPLSDFSVHQIDKVKDPDQSYVEERKHPHALRQAHGSLALAVDDLVKAITDAAPDELFWDQLSLLTLAPGSVSSVHSLKEYCPVLEQLTMSGNRISQVGGLPSTLRILDIHDGMINDLTAWGHLRNLQYLDVSGCQLESLEGFSSLLHLRSLKASNNRISNIDGILDLDGLLDLDLSGNEVTRVDFEGCELTRLKTLNLSHNQLQDIKNLTCLPVLEDLDVSYNSLKHFSVSSSDASVPLRKLQVSHNDLDLIGLKDMPALRHLDLDNNNVKDIQGLSSAYHLEFLSLREQKVHSDIVELVLTTPNECRHIRLSSNAVINGTFRLPTLPQNNLRELEIAACGISELPERFGLYFPNCRHLNANFNAIKEIAPLRKMVHLNTLLLAKNRIQRLRRTCLVMSRLPSLEQIDLRDNPLTVGFYSPATGSGAEAPLEARYHLPAGSEAEDSNWIKVLDEVTGLKRRTIELLLAEHCKGLVQLDGLELRRAPLRFEDETWNRLTSKKVLVKPSPEGGNEAACQCDHMGDTSTGGFIEGSKTPAMNDGDVFDSY
ncbi:Protein nud1 [Cladophialophora chaetospira]|uniref:Protein nud1 n=1 Tax=Cladophialophora chaetospira TaxID=386627 RepID=A0AA39CBX6_9EURO|nr:Protein nud1 [Cladophialophora chaetospira]